MDSFDLSQTFWDKQNHFVSELRVDSRWLLRSNHDEKSCGSLRIASFPDLKPGYLRAIFTYVVSMLPKTIDEKIKAIEDYQIEMDELEVYSIDNSIVTDTKTYEAPFKELEALFGVKIF